MQKRETVEGPLDLTNFFERAKIIDDWVDKKNPPTAFQKALRERMKADVAKVIQKLDAKIMGGGEERI